MNIHFTHDDKFLDYFIVNAVKYSVSKNIYVVFSNYPELIYTKSTKNVIVIPYVKNDVEKILSNNNRIKNIYFHAFQEFYTDLIEEFSLHEKYKLIWLFYGFEVFNLSRYKNKFLLDTNLKWYKKQNKFKINLNLKQFLYKIKKIVYRKIKVYQNEKKIIRGIKKIHYCGHFIEEDFEKYIKPINSKIKYINWNYMGFGTHQPTENNVEKTKTRLILGNSASEENNHLDGLLFLRKLNFENKLIEIVSPLSYSGLQSYVTEVNELGNKLFGSFFKPLLDFIPKEDYLNFILSADCAIYFNLRSQAAGNIMWFIENNIPVFMHKNSTLYRFLISKHFCIFELSDFQYFLNSPDIFFSKVKFNKNQLEKYFGESAMAYKYRNILEL